MSSASEWEQRFVKRYIVKSKQDRYLALLGDDKRRRKILDRLCHNLDYDERKATDLHKRYGDLLPLLRAENVASTCYLMADSSDLDGSELDLETGVRELLLSYFGAVLICPPRPIALYKPEHIKTLILLK